jgi:hypothetical protein
MGINVSAYSPTKMTPFWIFFFIFYSYKYLIYICIYSRLSVITAFFKPLKLLIATDLVGYQFLITDYEIGYRLSVIVGYRLRVSYNRPG